MTITSTFESLSAYALPGFQGHAGGYDGRKSSSPYPGQLLMAYSNKFGHLVLTTGNKSEMSVGYATLYGDMAGGFAVIKDVPKTMVYELATSEECVAAVSGDPEADSGTPAHGRTAPGSKG